MTTKFKYFHHGYPVHNQLPVYAIYQPVLDCFLFVTDSLQIAESLRHLLSSRYTSWIVCPNTADNYEYNLIDNTVCENWTLRDPLSSIKMHDSLEHQKHVIYADHLVPSTHMISWDIDREKQWCFICQSYFNAVDLCRQKMPNSDSTRHHYYQKIENTIYDFLYLERDPELVEQKIKSVLESDSILWSLFLELQKSHE
jgi:hypothetical protein